MAKSHLIINVEVLAGTPIDVAIREAKAKARQWGVAYVSFKFNGIEVDVGPTANVGYLMDKYWEALKDGESCIVSA